MYTFFTEYVTLVKVIPAAMTQPSLREVLDQYIGMIRIDLIIRLTFYLWATFVLNTQSNSDIQSQFALVCLGIEIYVLIIASKTYLPRGQQSAAILKREQSVMIHRNGWVPVLLQSSVVVCGCYCLASELKALLL